MAQFLANERYGNGSSGALVISSNTTESPTDSACTGSSGATSLSATNVSFAAGQVILIHQTQGSGAGNWELNVISSYVAGTITTKYALSNSYGSGAQVRVLNQYTSVTVNGGVTWTAKAWNGGVGGILAFLCNGLLTVTGNISANGCGFRGGAGATSFNTIGVQGESTLGTGAALTTANGSGGGAGQGRNNNFGGGGGGGGHGTAGSDGGAASPDGTQGTGGAIGTDSASLSTAWFGSGGGGGGFGDAVGSPIPGNAGNGGGWILTISARYAVTGAVSANGSNGVQGDGDHGSGAGGAGGSVKFKSETGGSLGSSLVTASAGTGAPGNGGNGAGGDGGVGRISADYGTTAPTGTTAPALNSSADSSLATTFFGGIL